MVANDNRETRQADAEKRRALDGNTLFENLGEPIKRLLMQVNKDVSNEDLSLYSKITVRQLAKVFDMLALEEDPEKILAWLHREALRGRQNDPGAPKQHGGGIRQGAARDPIKFYKELEKKNLELMEKFQKAQADREEDRALNVAERKRRREQRDKEAEEEKTADGGDVSSVDKLKKGELADIVGTFERFSAKQSTYDNSNSNQDTEWWKKDEYRRDWEKNGVKGKLWTRVVEGGSQDIPESERQVREEWFRDQVWWKSDKYRRDWLASRDTEWWKEENYIRDWQDHQDKGSMWTASDEISGFNKKGHRRPASAAELARRVEWYKNNGPKGIVKLWCAFSDGSFERCTLEEKRERDDYFKNGDWWKSDVYIQKIRENPGQCNALRCAGAAAEDRDWWKDDQYRKDFEKGGSQWKALNEKAAVTRSGQMAPSAEAARREEWFKSNWWKCEKYINDFKKNGTAGKLWRLASGSDEGGKFCTTVELRQREEWLKSADDREWWKDEALIRDWQENGQSGKKWKAAWAQAADECTGDTNSASVAELNKREQYFKQNWWKQEKFVKEFMANKGAQGAWKSTNGASQVDGEWWKQGQFVNEYQASKEASGEAYWQSPQCIADYWKSGSSGKKWTAATAAASSVGLGDEVQATAEALGEREAFYQSNWWRQDEFARDFAANGKSGKLWKAANADGTGVASPQQIRERQAYFDPKGNKKVRAGFNAMFGADAEDVPLGSAVSPQAKEERVEYYENNFWKQPDTVDEYAQYGSRSKKLRAATVHVARADLSNDMPATTAEVARRERAVDRGLVDEPWRQNDFSADLNNTAEFWQKPECIEDFLQNGRSGKKWTASTAAAGSTSKGDQSQLAETELKTREEFFKNNFWKSRQYQSDFEKNGAKGTFWTNSEPAAKGAKASEAEIRARAQTFKAPQQRERDEYVKKNWWKAPEVRADFERNGRNSKLIKAATCAAAVSGLGANPDYQAPAAEIEARAQYFESGAKDDKVSNAELSRAFTSAEEFWMKPDLIDDFVKNGSNGKKWKAASAATASAANPSPASDSQIANREAFLNENFWKGAESVADFATNGTKGKLWKAQSPGSSDPCSTADLVARFEHFCKPVLHAAEMDEYAKKNWWKAPEVRADFAANGRNGKLFKAATAGVAAVGLGNQPQYQASDDELDAREAFFTSNAKDGVLPDSAFSQQIESVKNLGKNFWIAPEYVDDFVKNGAKGRKWTGADAAAASTSNGDSFRAHPEEIAQREAFFKKNFWKATPYLEDFIKNGESGNVWKSADLNDKVTPADAADVDERFAYYTQPVQEELERQDHFKNNWWKTPEAVADFAANGKKSKFVTASSAAVAQANLAQQPELQASPSEVASRVKFFESFAKGDITAPSDGYTDSQLVAPIKPIDDSWWRDSAFAKEFFNGQEAEFWKNPEFIEDYLKNGRKGKKWTAQNAAAGSTASADRYPASEDELKTREEFMKENFWKAPEYIQDFEENGLKGTLWTNSEPNGKGQPISEAEMKARSQAYRPTKLWQQHDKPSENGKTTSCGQAEALDREKWFEDNWWKSDEVKEDFAANGSKSLKIRAATSEALRSGDYKDPKYQIPEGEVKKRIAYFETLADNEWWKSPIVVSDFVKNKEEGAAWKSQTQKDAVNSLGAEVPASEKELKKRREWFNNNYWRTPEAIQDYHTNGNKGRVWKSNANGDGDAPADELKSREKWFQENKPVDAEEEGRRKEWMERQLSDEEKQNRRDWMVRKAEDAKKIHRDELVECLKQLNDGETPTDEQVAAIEDAVLARRAELGEDSTLDGITQEEFVDAVANTNFYLGATDEERERAEAEALEALHREEMARLEEEAGYLALEAQEELEAAGLEYVEEDELNEEEQQFLDEIEEEEAAPALNEDDVAVDAEAEKAYQEFLDQQDGIEEGDQPDGISDEEGQLQEEAPAEDTEAVWQSEEIGGDEGEEDAMANEADLKEEIKEELEEVVNDEGWGEGDEPAVEMPQEEVIDEMQQEEKGHPQQWKLPLPEVTNPQFLKAYFTVIKYTPSHSFLGGKQKRVWVVDHFTRCFYNLDKNGKIKKEHAANKLLQLERNLLDSTRLRLMFFDAAHSYELQFFNTEERERFYETASAIRPSIRVFAPDMTNPDPAVEACTTTVDGVGPNAVTVTCNNQSGKPVQRELTGECKVNASKLLTEPLTIWCGTFNLQGHRPPKKQDDLKEWMPKDKYDIYAVAVQEASFRREENEWFEYVQHYLGKDYLTLASMFMWDTMLIVLTRKKHLLKITNVEGSTKATMHKAVCGTKGGIGISIRFLETSICFVTCQLAARIERNAMRNANIEEIVDCLQLGIRETDICNQFNHLFFFGDFNYRVELDPAEATKLIAGKKYQELLGYDQFLGQRQSEGVLHGFNEPPITFAPTYRLEVGRAEKYMQEKGNAPSYCDRVVTRSMANTWVKCTSYRSAPSVIVSEHQPVAATFIIRCVRPVLSCFMKSQQPIPEFIFESVQIRDSTGPVMKKPTLMFSTPFTQVYRPVESKTTNTATPLWNESDLPHLVAVSQVKDYIETCHIILIVREGSEKREDKAHRGTGVITLFGRVNQQQGTMQDFETDLLCHGKTVAKIYGRFSWVPTSRNSSNPDLKMK
ncbi:inositol 5-phosphatase 1, putative [Bodo saltans]|uniref:Inositol 5-phosphatase 1, putative n=1 Tax=Bodo saltans TaxID=75058 RepID=A0A0S4KJ39_BODSA|nr:inositol 5-phosphatase 1, putative [Bodo saltans]|eukprot:CUI15184.1 inositol 5-phosphatase 1, putative [Bodo saltans]